MWHIQDSQGLILAWAFWSKSVGRLEVVPSDLAAASDESQRKVVSEHSAHIGAIGLALEPLVW